MIAKSPTRPLSDVSTVAARLSVSAKTVRRWADSGQMPKPIRVGRLLRWRPEVIDQWVADGCPSRESHARSTNG